MKQIKLAMRATNDQMDRTCNTHLEKPTNTPFTNENTTTYLPFYQFQVVYTPQST